MFSFYCLNTGGSPAVTPSCWTSLCVFACAGAHANTHKLVQKDPLRRSRKVYESIAPTVKLSRAGARVGQSAAGRTALLC